MSSNPRSVLPRPRERHQRLRSALVGAAIALLTAPAVASSQQGCQFGDEARSFHSITLAGGGQMIYLGRPHFVCDDGVQIRADSAVVYAAQNMSHLLGNVRYVDSTRELEADEARYFSRVARLQAQGHLVVRDTVQGSVVENGDLVYLRKSSLRDEDQMTFRTWVDGLRPTALLYMKASEPESAVADEGPDLPAAPGEAAAEAAEAAGEALGPALAGTQAPAVPPRALRDSSSISIAPPGVSPEVGLEPPRAEHTPALRDSSSISVSEPDTSFAPGASPVDTVPATGLPPTSTPADTVPYRVTGDEIFLHDNTYFRATGNVLVERDAIRAYGGVAEYDQVAGRILLEREARVESDSYDLEGRVINIGMVDGAMREIRAVRDGILIGEDLTLKAPTIQLFLDAGVLERLVAIPMAPDPDSVLAGVPVDSTILERPVAVAQEFTLIADSLDVRSPGEVLDRIVAVGAARGESRARDSLNVDALPEAARSDWLEGDTVVASFVEVMVLDSLSESGTRADYRLDRLEAKSDARTLYRLQPTDTTRVAGVDPPAVHYVRGQEILIALRDGEVDYMDVRGQTRGFHLEPLQSPSAEDSLAVADSAAVADTVGVEPPADTLQSTVRPDTIRPDAIRPDAIRPDTIQPDTVGSEAIRGTAGDVPTGVVVRPGRRSAPGRGPRPQDPYERSRRPW